MSSGLAKNSPFENIYREDKNIRVGEDVEGSDTKGSLPNYYQKPGNWRLGKLCSWMGAVEARLPVRPRPQASGTQEARPHTARTLEGRTPALPEGAVRFLVPPDSSAGVASCNGEF